MPKPTPAAKPADDLADLRQAFGGAEDDARTPPEPLNDDQADPDTPEGVSVALVAPQDRETARAEVIAAWHADTVATGFLHRGGRCGCRYIADRALDAVAPVQANDDTPDE